MQLNDITLSDKELFNKHSSHSGITSQFCGFVNLFLWKDAEKIKYFIHNEKLFVTGISSESGMRYFMFPNAFNIKREDILFLKENFKESWSIECLSKNDAKYLWIFLP